MGEVQLTAGCGVDAGRGYWGVQAQTCMGITQSQAYVVLDPKGRIWKEFYGRGAFKRALVLMELLGSAYQDGKEAASERNLDA